MFILKFLFKLTRIGILRFILAGGLRSFDLCPALFEHEISEMFFDQKYMLLSRVSVSRSGR